jgi:nickel-dependent lactate racemase
VTHDEVRQTLAAGLDPLPSRRRYLVLIPDGTRHAPMPMLFHLLTELLGPKASRLDFLVALGTHPPMSEDAIDRLVGVPGSDRASMVFNHEWDRPSALTRLGTLSAATVEDATGGLMGDAIAVDLNRAILDYDHLVICGPVFPHEVAGFSGGAKYIVPGIAGPEVISATHWLGALTSSMQTIGFKDTAVRRLINRATELVPRPITCIALVVQSEPRLGQGEALRGLWVSDYEDAWSRAADLSAQLEIVRVERGYRRVLSMPSAIYDDLWTAAKAMYKTEPAIADGGEVVIYAPDLTEISYTHGRLIDEVGYHVLDYFIKQPDRFASVPGVVRAHSTHVKGAGSYDAEAHVEHPRIDVILATGISEERTRRVNLGYLDPRTIDVDEWEGREPDGVLAVHNAGEVLYRAGDLAPYGAGR